MYSISLTNPWHQFRDAERLFAELQRSLTRDQWGAHIPGHATTPINVYCNDQQILVTAEAPGLDPADVEVSVLGDSLTIKGKRRVPGGETISFSRNVELPYTVDADRTEAHCRDGILSVTLRRPESEKPRKISVKAA